MSQEDSLRFLWLGIFDILISMENRGAVLMNEFSLLHSLLQGQLFPSIGNITLISSFVSDLCKKNRLVCTGCQMNVSAVLWQMLLLVLPI